MVPSAASVGRAVDVAAELDRPAQMAVRLETIEAVILRAEQDGAARVDQRRRHDAIAGAECPRQRAVQLDGVELRVERADVDDAVADRRRRAHVAAGGERPAQRPVGRRARTACGRRSRRRSSRRRRWRARPRCRRRPGSPSASGRWARWRRPGRPGCPATTVPSGSTAGADETCPPVTKCQRRRAVRVDGVDAVAARVDDAVGADGRARRRRRTGWPRGRSRPAAGRRPSARSSAASPGFGVTA